MQTEDEEPQRTKGMDQDSLEGQASLASGSHWTTTKYSKNILEDALVKHMLGLMTYGMTDLGEVLEVAGQIEHSDEESWISTWGAMAERLQDRAHAAENSNNLVSAASAYLRASTYWRASLFCFSTPEDPRMRDYANASSICYRRYLALSGYPGQYVEIPYEDTFLPGYFYRSPVAAEKAPLLIITPGRDTWAEDTRWVYDGALRRGIHCLIYDGPGQGFALRLNRLAFRADWENVVTPIIDYAMSIPGIDPLRIGLMGLSFGGFLAPRAAAFDKRIKICIADPGNIRWGEAIISNLKKLSILPSFVLPAQMRKLVKDYAWKHNVPNNIEDVIQALEAYDNTSVLAKITCEMLVLDGSEEMSKDAAKQFFDALTCPKDYLLFDQASTAQSHCQIGGYATATEYIFDWLCQRL